MSKPKRTPVMQRNLEGRLRAEVERLTQQVGRLEGKAAQQEAQAQVASGLAAFWETQARQTAADLRYLLDWLDEAVSETDRLNGHWPARFYELAASVNWQRPDLAGTPGSADESP